jgi:hypothetical protein
VGRVAAAHVRWLVLGLLVLLGACNTPDAACAPTTAATSGTDDCADLLFKGRGYDELRTYDEPPLGSMQEIGNATYPDCNVPDGCPGSELDGLGSTDVYLIEGVDPEDALIGKRQNSDQHVILVRVGVDPQTLALPG